MLDVESYEKFKQSLYDILETRKQLIYEKSKNLSDKMSKPQLTSYHLGKFNTHILFNEETENVLLTEINQIISRDIAVLELFPGDGQFTPKLVSGDPFYIASYFQDNLEDIGNLFNNFYNHKRLMKLKIDDFTLPLPDDQIGLVVSFKFFFVKDLEFIVNWAREVFRVLSPGGSFIFNFIPDTSHGVRMAGQNLVSMINHKQLTTELTDIGYEIFKTSINNNYGSSITARKPGELTKIKMSSSNARIIDKSEPLV